MILFVLNILVTTCAQMPVVQAGTQQVDSLYAAVVTPKAIVLHYDSGGRRPIPGTADTSAVAFSADNRGVYFAGDTSLWYVALDGSGRRLVSAGWKMLDGLVVSPDGMRLAFSGYTAQAGWSVYTLDEGTGISHVVARGRLPAWMPDSRGLLFENDTDALSHIYRFDPDTRRVQRIAYDRDGTITTAVEVAVAPDGHLLAFVSNGGLRVKELDSDYVKMLTTGEHCDTRPVFSADATEILFMRQDRDPVGQRMNPRIMRIAVRSGRTEVFHEAPALDAAYPHPLTRPADSPVGPSLPRSPAPQRRVPPKPKVRKKVN